MHRRKAAVSPERGVFAVGAEGGEPAIGVEIELLAVGCRDGEATVGVGSHFAGRNGPLVQAAEVGAACVDIVQNGMGIGNR